MSDRPAGAPTLEERTDDIRAVMDAAGSERAFVFGTSEGGSMASVFAGDVPRADEWPHLVGHAGNLDPDG